MFGLRRPVALGIALLTAVPASAALASPGWAAGERPGPPGGAHEAAVDAVPGEVLVRFADTAPQATDSRTAEGVLAERNRAVDGVGGRIAESLDGAVPGLQRVVLDAGADVTKVASQLEARADVLYAEPNYVVRAAATPNDSRFRELWGLHNTGQRVQGVAGTADADIDAPEAWNVTTGSASVTVAVLDSGVAYGHPDLAPNMWANDDEVPGNGVDDDRNGIVDDRRGWDFVDADADPSDEQGHGTHVAGTIGARGNNDTSGAGTTDVPGIAWNVRLMPVRVLNENGEGSYADLIAGVTYAWQNGAHIANLSMGARYFSQALQEAMAAGSGTLWVVAAGNDSSDLGIAEQYPCKFEIANLVCVAATDSRDRLASFSNYGRTSVAVAAPGVNILSTSPYSRKFFDDFETSTVGRWVTGGTPNTWARTTSVPAYGATGTWLTDSPSGFYPDDSDNWARTNALNLTGTRDCVLKFNAVLDIESVFDFLRVEVATSTAGPWTEILGTSVYWPAPDEVLEARLPDSLDGAGSAYLRFRLDADEQYNGDGVFVDNVTLNCAGSYAADSFQYLSGTSMATPQVAGVAALVKARNPAFTTAQLRAKLLASVDTKSSLTGKVATGGRINAYKAVR
jgi:subtilisin family serine protease